MNIMLWTMHYEVAEPLIELCVTSLTPKKKIVSMPSKFRMWSVMALAAVSLVTRFYVFERSPSSSVSVSTVSSSHPVKEDYCSSSVGSLHSIALDMINHSSPHGSNSYNKLKHVLDLSTGFYINLWPPIFQQNEENIAALLEGYGLTRTHHTPPKSSDGFLLVETIYSSACSIEKIECATRPRILIQVTF